MKERVVLRGRGTRRGKTDGEWREVKGENLFWDTKGGRDGENTSKTNREKCGRTPSTGQAAKC